MEDNKRTLYFMGATLVAGLLVVGFMFIKTPSTPSAKEAKTTIVTSNHKDLQTKIDALSIDDISASKYNTLLQEISSSKDQRLFTPIIGENLTKDLKSKYIALSFKKADNIVNADPINDAALAPILSHLSTIGADNAKINSYSGIVNQVNYYNVILPNEVDKFTKRSFEYYNANQFKSLKAELENLPSKPALKGRKSVAATKANNINKLNKYFSDYVNYVEATSIN